MNMCTAVVLLLEVEKTQIVEDDADFFNALKSKGRSLAAGQHSDVLETLTPNVRKRVEALQEIQ
ncbi:hypothetical protein MKW94_004122, partial [Papaver nudicaule]|nr:hypothetical protein [Papaver nudicaule]